MNSSLVAGFISDGTCCPFVKYDKVIGYVIALSKTFPNEMLSSIFVNIIPSGTSALNLSK